jgi:flagellar motor switch protein FliN/FliY
MNSRATLESIIAASAAAVKEETGVAIRATDVSEADGFPETFTEESVARRLKAGDDGLLVAVSAEGAAGMASSGDAEAALDAFILGSAAAIDKVAGGLEAAAAAEAGEPSDAGDWTAVTFTITPPEGDPIPAVLAFGPSVAASIGFGHDAGPTVAEATFPDLGRGGPGGDPQDLKVLADVAMTVTVELGRTALRVRDLLGLSEGSVVELDQPAGAPVDILVNGTVVARGDVVVVDDELGVRITEVIERAE